ncbi:YggS family pyridoxal phosphate-dependent enzyme [Vogesella urethralis]|jgi:pyridoxal phosphate enzyme (YggS family)|uniref:YggS family pyridoxal phosphate-dependent enzyme n=1 Tax=Vogesella urethralis TaxID=2592656 RepID=UPI001186FDF2|nr:YggS family pyridoxal phosphate-dependent enzyme [Vogesella urethralis]MEC5205758.1 pyridoxal phosphate enzyme (YggS family) [Vogesella perlucida]
MSQLTLALHRVQTQLAEAAHAAGRDAATVQLLAVSKTFPAEAVREVYAAGQRAFGENYVQELQAKAAELADLAIEWHFIGPLQSNKTRIVAETAHWVHAIDRLKIAERLSAQRPAHLPPLQVCVQVNVSGEDSKSGCSPADAPALLQAVAALPGLQLRGLMCIPEPTQDAATLAARFGVLRQLQQQMAAQGLVLDTLSMGMSADMAQAIAAGSTLVRVGTAIFGARHYPA